MKATGNAKEGVDGKVVLLVGNPNVGKSVIFAWLTGRYTVVSNYPGTTVEIARGTTGPGHQIEVIDTPGVNSLFPASEDEKVTRDLIYKYRNAVIVQVADAKNIDRSLLLTTQLAETGCRMILVLNMMDEARQRGVEIDAAKLASILGIEVIEAVAVEKRGLSRIAGAIAADSARVPSVEVVYPDLIEKTARETAGIEPGLGRYGKLGILSLIAGDTGLFDGDASLDGKRVEALAARIQEEERKLASPFSYHIAAARRRMVNDITTAAVKRKELIKAESRLDWQKHAAAGSILILTAALIAVFGTRSLAQAGLFPSLPVLFALVLCISIAGVRRIDRWTLHPVYGVLFLAAIVYLVYNFVGVFAAGTLVDFIQTGLFDRVLIPAVEKVSGDGFVRDLLTGNYGLVSMGLSYSISIVLPIVIVFFLVFGMLEDTGYFPRLTVLTNRLFRMVGVNGKATLPVVLGFGCVTMAILASRILETKKERIIVITLLSLAIPCSAQLGVTMSLMSAISIPAVLTIMLIIVSEFLIVGSLLGRYLKGRTSDFILELPPLRVPRVSNIALKTGARARWFLMEAVPYFLVATLLIFTLDRTGALGAVHRAVEPVTKGILGLPLETASVFIIGFFRRDYGAAGLYRLWQSGLLTGNQIVVALTVMSLFLPCLASLIVMVKEIGIRYAMIIFFFVMAMSIATGGLLNLFLGILGVAF